MADPRVPGKGKVVCVTGASGFIGSHIARQLLERGYSVRATVRDASNTAKYGWLKSLADGTPGNLELYSADLESNGSYDDVMQGCELVCHVAAAVIMKAKDPQREIVDPTVEGTRNVFDSILKARAAKRVVLTSSISAVMDLSKPAQHVFTEEDWHTELSLRHPYPMAKAVSERHAWAVYEEQKGRGDGWSFELTAVNPAFVLGDILHKSHASTSVALIRMLLNGKMPFAPDFYWSVVHVRDVARVHVLCLEGAGTAKGPEGLGGKEGAKGRYIVAQEADISFLEAASIAKGKYPHLPAATAVIPTFLLYCMALFSPILSTESIELMSRRNRFSLAKAKNELGIEFVSPEETILDSVRSLIEFKKLPEAPPPSEKTESKDMFSFWGLWQVAT